MKVVNLMSGGIDSSVIAKILKTENIEVYPLYVNYGQLAAKKEWIACQKICEYLDLKRPVQIELPNYGKQIPSGITNSELNIFDNAFLPGRNLLLLLVAAAYAYTKSIHVIAIGLISNPIFPDQTTSFINSAEKTITESLGVETKILTPLITLNKLDIIRLAREYTLPLDLTYSCHMGTKKPCGKCISCKERMTAENNLNV